MIVFNLNRLEDYKKELHKNIESKFMESFMNELLEAMKGITKLLNSLNINFTFIGGSARNLLAKNYRTTSDIDLLVSAKDKEKMKNLPIGFVRELSKGRAKVFSWHDPKIKVEAIYSGEISGDGIKGLEYPEPDKISVQIAGMPIIRLDKMIEFKLSSGLYGNRDKDFADIQDLIKDNKLSLNYGNKFREDLNELYKKMWYRAYSQKEI